MFIGTKMSAFVFIKKLFTKVPANKYSVHKKVIICENWSIFTDALYRVYVYTYRKDRDKTTHPCRTKQLLRFALNPKRFLRVLRLVRFHVMGLRVIAVITGFENNY